MEIAAIAGLVLAWAKAPLPAARLKERASVSVCKEAGARTKVAGLVLTHELESRLWFLRARFPQVQLCREGPGSFGVLQVES
jgi:hypothetical protein